MNEPKVTDLDYINFLLAAPRVVSCTEGARVQPDGSQPAAHDALNRLLHRLKADTTPLWQEAAQFLDRTRGLLIIDDTTLDKPYAQKIALVHRHWSGKHHRIVAGIIGQLLSEAAWRRARGFMSEHLACIRAERVVEPVGPGHFGDTLDVDVRDDL